MKDIVFYNHWHNGDLHYSRGFCSDIQNQLGTEYNFKYAHVQRPYVVEDICEHIPLDDSIDKFLPVVSIDNTVYINTWVGLGENRDCKYYKSVGYCGLETNYQIFKDTYNILNTNYGFNLKLNLNKDHYLPEINFNKIKSSLIRPDFDKKIILICNNYVNSNQAYNYNLNPVIERISSEFKNETFAVTNRVDDHVFTQPNVHYIDNFDLNQVGYYSLFAKVIIGRGSGPFCFAFNKQNVLNTEVTFIGLGNTDHGSPGSTLHTFWGRIPDGLNFFNSSPDLNSVYDTIVNGIHHNNQKHELI